MGKWVEVAEAFTIFAKYSQEGAYEDVCAEHDEILAGPMDADVVSAEDLARLDDLGWSPRPDGGFLHFV